VDCKQIFIPSVEHILKQDQLTQVRAHPGGMQRNVARADCPPGCLKADCLRNRANAELRRQPDDVHPAADNEKLDVSSPVAIMANTTLQREFESVSGPDRAQVIRRWVVAGTVVEAGDETVDVVLAGVYD